MGKNNSSSTDRSGSSSGKSKSSMDKSRGSSNSSGSGSGRQRHGSLDTSSVGQHSSSLASTSGMGSQVIEAPPTMKRTCENCTRVKVKCEGYPICKRCERRGMECVFREQHKRGRKRQPEYFTQPPMQPYQVVSGGQTYLFRPGQQQQPQQQQPQQQQPQQQQQPNAYLSPMQPGGAPMLPNFANMAYFNGGMPQQQQQQQQQQQPMMQGFPQQPMNMAAAFGGVNNAANSSSNVQQQQASGADQQSPFLLPPQRQQTQQQQPNNNIMNFGNPSGNTQTGAADRQDRQNHASASTSSSNAMSLSNNNNTSNNNNNNVNIMNNNSNNGNNNNNNNNNINPFLGMQLPPNMMASNNNSNNNNNNTGTNNDTNNSNNISNGNANMWMNKTPDALGTAPMLQVLLQQQQQQQGQHPQQNMGNQFQQLPFLNQAQTQPPNPMMMMWMPQQQQQLHQQLPPQVMPMNSMNLMNSMGMPAAMAQQTSSNQQFLAGLQTQAPKPPSNEIHQATPSPSETRKQRSPTEKTTSSRKRARETSSSAARSHHHKHHHHYHGHNSSQYRRQRDSGGSSGSEEESERQNTRPEKRPKPPTVSLANESPSSEERVSSLTDPLRRILVVFFRLLGPQMQDRYFRILSQPKGKNKMPRFVSMENSRSNKAIRFFFSTLIRFFNAKGDTLSESVARKWADKLQYNFTSRDPCSRLGTALAREDPASGEMYVGPRVSRPYQSSGTGSSRPSEDEAVPFTSAAGSGSGPSSGESSGSFSGSVEGVSSNSGGENQTGSDRDSGSNSNSNELRRDMSPSQRSSSPPGTPMEIEERYFRLKETNMSSGLAWLLGNGDESLENTRTPLVKIACLWRHNKNLQGSSPYVSFVDMNSTMKSILGARSPKQLLPFRGFCDGLLPYGLDPFVEMLVSPEEVTRYVQMLSSKIEHAVMRLRRPSSHHGEQSGSGGSSGGSSGGVLGSSGSNSNNQSGSNSGSGNDTAALVSADYSSSSSSHSGLGGSAGNGSGASDGNGRSNKETEAGSHSRHHHMHHRAGMTTTSNGDGNEDSSANKMSSGSTGSGTESAAGSGHGKSINGSEEGNGAKRSTKAILEATKQARAEHQDSANKTEPRKRLSVEMLSTDMLHVIVEENGCRVPRLCRVSTLLRVTQVSISGDDLQIKMRAGKDFLLESVVTLKKLEVQNRDDSSAGLLEKSAASSLHKLPSNRDVKQDHVWLDEMMRLLLRPL